MSASPSPSPPASDRFLVGLAGVIAAAAVVAAASSVLRLENIAARVDQLEHDKPALLDVGKQLGTLTEKIGALKDTVDEIRKDQRADRRPTTK